MSGYDLVISGDEDEVYETPYDNAFSEEASSELGGNNVISEDSDDDVDYADVISEDSAEKVPSSSEPEQTQLSETIATAPNTGSSNPKYDTPISFDDSISAYNTPLDLCESSEEGTVKPLGENHWNEQFRRALALEDEAAQSKALAILASDFSYAAISYAKIIISELGVEKKTVEPINIGGIAGGDKYLVAGILFKFALDTTGMYGGDHWAAKAMGKELLGASAYAGTGIKGIHCPLMIIIDYRGFRVLAESVLPVDKSTIVYGSCDAGRTVHCDPQYSPMMDAAASILNLKKHRIQTSVISSACDVEGHKGRDGLFYLLDLPRVFPPEGDEGRKKKGAVFHRFLRPEFVQSLDTPLNSDAFTRFSRMGHERGAQQPKVDDGEVKEATRVLHDERIPAFAERLATLKTKDAILEMLLHMHRYGLNRRHLGLICKLLDDSVIHSRVICTEMAARACKRLLREEWRTAMRSTGIRSEVYKERVVHLLNQITNADERMWARVCEFVLEGFRYELKSHLGIDIVLVVHRFTKMCNVELTGSSLECLKSYQQFDFFTSDVVSCDATVKKLNVLNDASAQFLLHEAVHALPNDRNRLWARVESAFQVCIDSAPNSHLTLSRWGLLLLRRSLGTEIGVDERERLLRAAAEKTAIAQEIAPSSVEVAMSRVRVLALLGTLVSDAALLEQAKLLYSSLPVNSQRKIQTIATQSVELLSLATFVDLTALEIDSLPRWPATRCLMSTKVLESLSTQMSRHLDIFDLRGCRGLDVSAVSRLVSAHSFKELILSETGIPYEALAGATSITIQTLVISSDMRNDQRWSELRPKHDVNVIVETFVNMDSLNDPNVSSVTEQIDDVEFRMKLILQTPDVAMRTTKFDELSCQMLLDALEKETHVEILMALTKKAESIRSDDVPRLFPLLKHSNADIRVWTVVTLQKTDSNQVASLLIDNLAHEKDRFVKEATCAALAKYRVGVDQLFELYRNDPISNVRTAAQVALMAIGGDKVDALFESAAAVQREMERIIAHLKDQQQKPKSTDRRGSVMTRNRSDQDLK